MKMKNSLDSNTTGYLQVFIGGALWGTVGLFMIPLSSLGVDSMTGAFLRIGWAFVLMLIISIVKYGPKVFRVSLRTILVSILLGAGYHGVYNVFYMVAVVDAGASTAAICLRIAPIITALMSVVVLKEIFGRYKGVALALNIVGCTLAVFTPAIFMEHGKFTGILCGLAAGAIYGFLPLMLRLLKEEVNPMILSVYSYFFATVFLAFTAAPWNHVEVYTPAVLGIGVLFGLVPTALAYVIYYAGVDKVKENSRIPVIASVEVVSAAMIGILIFGENLSILNIIGLIILFVSIVMISNNKN